MGCVWVQHAGSSHGQHVGAAEYNLVYVVPTESLTALRSPNLPHACGAITLEEKKMTGVCVYLASYFCYCVLPQQNLFSVF